MTGLNVKNRSFETTVNGRDIYVYSNAASTTAAAATATAAAGVPAVVGYTWYTFRDLFSADIGAGLIDGTAATPGTGNRSATDGEGIGYITDPRLILPAQASASWGDLRVQWPAITRATGRCLAALICPDDQDSDFAFGLAASTPSGDPRTNGSGIFMGDKMYGAVTPGASAYMSAVRGARPVQYLAIVALSDIGSIVMLATPDTLTGLGNADPGGVSKYTTARLLWADYTDTTASLIPYLSGADDTQGVQIHDLRVVDVATWASADYLAAFADRFTRDDSNTALGNSWSADNGTWGIDSNQAYEVTSTGRGLASHATTLSDGNGIWHWRIKIPNGDAEGILRFKDVDNYIALDIYPNVMALYKRVAGSNTVIYQTGVGVPSAGNTYDIDIIAIGNQYNIFIDGASVAGWLTDAGSAHLSETRIGLGTWLSPSGELFDNVACWPLTVTLPAELQLGTVPDVLTAGATLASDTFTDTNGTRLNAHTPTAGGAWTEHSGTWTIQSNKATLSGTDNCFVTQDLGTTDAELSVTITTPGSGDTFYAGITARWVDVNNQFHIRTYMNPAQPSNDEIEFWRVSGGTPTAVRIYNLGEFFATSTSYTLKIQCSGRWMHIWIDTYLVASYYTESTDPAGTRFGLYRDGTSDAGCVFDGWSAKAV